MGEKTIRDLLLLVSGFGIIWVVFSYVDIFPDEIDLSLPVEHEESLGDLMLQAITASSEVLEDPYIDSVMYMVSNRLLENIGPTDYEFNIVVIDDPMVNAATLPGANIIVFTGLIEFVESPEELAAVLAHEFGHVQNKDVIQKLIKEIGLEILIASSGANGDIGIGEVIKTFGGSVFDRNQEREADQFALDLMARSGIDPIVIADFFQRLSDENGDFGELLEMLSTHPNNNARIKMAGEYVLPDDFKAEAYNIDWPKVQDRLDTGYSTGFDLDIFQEDSTETD